jgi:uncharacterized membrane protein
LPGRVRPAGAGWDWIAKGWTLFMRAPLMWVISIVVLFVLGIVVSLIPVIGSLAFQLLTPVFAAGFVLACRSLERGGDFELEHLFAAFKAPHLVPLLILGALFLAGMIVILLVGMAIMGTGVAGAILSGNAADLGTLVLAAGASILLGTLVMLALSVPLLAAYWFAPALIVMHGVTPVAAMKESFSACLRNFVPFLVYGLIMTVFAILAALPFFLGYLAWIPLAITSTYAAYRDIFTEEAASPATVPLA